MRPTDCNVLLVDSVYQLSLLLWPLRIRFKSACEA